MLNSRAALTVLLTFIGISFVTPPTCHAETRQPNIIFVLADDLGWSELGCYGNRFNETPHLDQLAKEGMRFTAAYASAPVCSPYRASFLTGRYPARIGILDYLRPNSANGLSQDHVTLPDRLQQLGYRTGMIGKWHLTGYKHHGAEFETKPREHGFDWDIAREVKGVGNGANFWPYVFRTQEIRWIDLPVNRLGDDEFLIDRMNREAVDFIQRNKDRPFFLFLSHYGTHTILNGKRALVEEYRKKHPPGKSTRQRCYLCQDQGHQGDPLHHWAGDHNPHLAAMLESIDEGIGMITRKLRELGLAENTILVFTSDNGGETNVTSNAPLRGGKSQLYEGGIRVPLVVRWPKTIPAAAVCERPTTNVDFYPTLLEAVGDRPPANVELDGISTLRVWKDPRSSKRPRSLFWHYPLDRAHFLGGRSSGAIRKGDWKLIEHFDSGQVELFSLADDVSESRNLAASMPKVRESLKRELVHWRRSIGARLPSPPLLAEPRRLYFADHFSTGRVSGRWFFNKDWFVRDGVLQRAANGSDNTRIFVKKPKYRDVVIRFDFQLRQSRDIRLVTGGGGHYNAVIHIRPDHFFVQTALDRSGPYYPYRHGECAFDFQPDQWYTMTVEFVGDQLLAHIDRQHLVYARHPILNKERSYFAFQVDGSAASFDNVQILTAGKHPRAVANLAHVKAYAGRFPVQKPLREQFKIRKVNAHESFYRSRAAYRDLVLRVQELDKRNKRLHPEVFRSHKETRKAIASRRKSLRAENARYKELEQSTRRATRALDDFLVAKQPDVARLPDSRRKHELEQLRRRYRQDKQFVELLKARDDAERRLKQAFPELFISDEQILQSRRAARHKADNNPAFRRAVNERAAAWRAQQAYLFKHDKELADIDRRLND